MSAWTTDELSKIEAADELELASRRRDGTLRNPVTVWVVRHGDDLYVRSWRGRTATWFRSVRARPEGHIRAGGVLKEVQFVDPDPGVDDALDAAYRAKYRRRGASYVDQMVSPEARSATIRLVPR
ncbi:MAG TPA: DUF2255 family protein [Chloroflexota bacterium]|jgi:hypothetical protein